MARLFAINLLGLLALGACASTQEQATDVEREMIIVCVKKTVKLPPLEEGGRPVVRVTEECFLRPVKGEPVEKQGHKWQ
jgi:hypothetical protein